MSQQDVYRVHPLAPLHLGERGVGMEETAATVASDTLFSALCWAVLELEGPGWLDEWLGAFARQPAPFLITSAFPWAGDIRFYPRPMVPVPVGRATSRSATVRKRLKKATYVSEQLFERLARGQSVEGEMEDTNFLPGGIWIAAAERDRLPPGLARVWAGPDVVPRVALDRLGSAASLYYVGEVRYSEGCGLWFAVRWREAAWRDVLEKALSCLGEAGIGGERSSGRGQFRWERWEEASIPGAPSPDQLGATLSLYHPTVEEVRGGALEAGSYRLRTRRGWVGSLPGQGWRGKAVRMLVEGSVVGAAAVGDLTDVTPDGFAAHRVYRYGLAFNVGVGSGHDG